MARAGHFAQLGGAGDFAGFDDLVRLPVGEDELAGGAGMRVHPERMRKNLELTRGLVFSGQLLLDLAAAGMLRETAYKVVQGEAMKAWETDGDFRAAMEAHPEVTKLLAPEQIARAFSLGRQLGHVEAIFERVFSQ